MGDKITVAKKPEGFSDTRKLQRLISIESEKREILKRYISDHMKEGTDYGKIHVSRNCDNKYNCKVSGHFSKDCLFKPGSEKFISLMHLKAKFKRDNDTWEMLGKTNGTIAYVCELYDQKDLYVGEGRGAATVQAEGTPNKAVKIAQKRAQLDAVLRTGGLSDFFTQDMEDKSERENTTRAITTTPRPQSTVNYQKRPETTSNITRCAHCNTTNQYHSPQCPEHPSNKQAAPEAEEGRVLNENVDPDDIHI